MYKFLEPKNQFEKKVNELYDEAEQYIHNRTFVGFEPIFGNLLSIYQNLTYDQQVEMWEKFYNIYYLAGPES